MDYEEKQTGNVYPPKDVQAVTFTTKSEMSAYIKKNGLKPRVIDSINPNTNEDA